MFQKIIVAGNLTRDPEMKFTDSGRRVCTFGIAVDNRSDGEKYPMWIRIVAFDDLAEQCAQYLKRGRKVVSEGRLVVDKKTGGPPVFIKKDGTPSASFEMIANSVTFVDSGNRDEASAAREQEKPTQKPQEPVHYDEDEFPVF